MSVILLVLGRKFFFEVFSFLLESGGILWQKEQGKESKVGVQLYVFLRLYK